jgi:hypothetical protein
LGQAIFRRSFHERRADCIVAGWMVCSFAGVATGGYFRPHYFIQIIPAVAILAGEAATGSLLVERITGFRRPIQLFALCSIALIVALAADPWYYRPGSPEAKCQELYFDQPFAVAAEVGHYLRDNSKASDTVFVLGSEPQFLYFAERKSATRYIFTYPLFSPDGETPALQQRVLDEVRASQPEFVVTVFLVHSLMMSGEHGHLGILEDVRKIVQASYHVVAAVPNEEDRVVTGPVVSQLYGRAPFWYDRPMATWWARVLIWQRTHRD